MTLKWSTNTYYKDSYVLKGKSGNMFDNFKSPETLNSKTLSLTILNQNILYITRQADAILKRVDMLIHDLALQKQVDDYYPEDKKEDIPEEA